jgi:hypothetical protein
VPSAVERMWPLIPDRPGDERRRRLRASVSGKFATIRHAGGYVKSVQ